jgi:hypothetical protein
MKGVTRFLSRHTKLLPLAGALVLFVTYVVKEGLEQTAKDQASEIAISQVRYWQTAYYIDEMTAIMTHERRDSGLSGASSSFGDDVASAWWGVDRSLDELNGDSVKEFESATLLLRNLPNDSEANKDHDAATLALEKLRSISARADEVFGDFSERDSTTKKATRDQLALSDEAETDLAQWHDAMRAFIPRVIAEAETQQEKSERRSEVFSKFSYFLFGIGWIIAFAGKLLNLPSEGPE